MVTVTNANVKVRYLDEWPPDVTDAAVTALCTQAEAFIQGRTTETVDLTSAAAIQLSVDLVVNWIADSQFIHAGGAGAAGVPRQPVWTKEMEERFQVLLQGSEEVIDTIDSHDYYVT